MERGSYFGKENIFLPSWNEKKKRFYFLVTPIIKADNFVNLEGMNSVG